MANKSVLHDSSEITIGIVGPTQLIDLSKKTLKSFPNFNPIFRDTPPTSDITEITKDILEKVDVLLFTEFYLYNLAKATIETKVPVHYIPLMGTGLYRALFLIRTSYGLKQLSIDTVEETYVRQILAELEEKNNEIHVYKNSFFTMDIVEIIKYHKENYKKHQTIALTGIQEVSNHLSELNIPNQWVTPTRQDMIVSLERALLATNTRKNKESQIVFGLINIDHFKQITESFNSEHEIQLLKLQIQEMLLDYIKQLDGHLINLGGEEYSFITTRGIFERETRGYKFIPLLQESKSNVGITLSIGVGFGSTATEAGNHARLALRQSKESGGNVCYIVREDRSVIGPVEINSEMNYETYDLAITDTDLIDKAEKAGMSAAYMTKLMARVSRYGKVDYTAQELASTLKITVRSAHRILLKWMDAEIVDIIGEEKLTYKGRPRRVYRLSFLQED